jgi:TRAP-type C4-dicarboxylate transport system substrate-binding protein
MKIRTVTAVVAFFALIASLLPALAQAQEVVLKVSHFLPPVSPGQKKFIEPWCDKIAAESLGKMKCQIYPSMQLGGTPPQLVSQVRDGVADIIWTLPGYTPGRFPISEVFELPFFATTPEATSRALWDFIQKDAIKEFAGMRLITTWVPGPYVLHLRDKEVKTLGDLKGMKVRGPSRLGTKLLAALGAVPVGMPVPQMAESLSKGVIEAAIVPWEVVPPTKTHELTKYSAEIGGDHAMLASTMIFAMNKAKYDSLPADLKKVIDDNSGRETSAWVAGEFLAADAPGRKMAQDRGTTIYQISADEVSKWKAAAMPVTEEWIKEVSANGVDGQKMYDDAAGLVAQYSK